MTQILGAQPTPPFLMQEHSVCHLRALINMGLQILWCISVSTLCNTLLKVDILLDIDGFVQKKWQAAKLSGKSQYWRSSLWKEVMERMCNTILHS